MPHVAGGVETILLRYTEDILILDLERRYTPTSPMKGKSGLTVSKATMLKRKAVQLAGKMNACEEDQPQRVKKYICLLTIQGVVSQTTCQPSKGMTAWTASAWAAVLVDKENLEAVWDAHRKFCDKWKITYPLHSYEIRGGRGNFSWLKNPERAVEFLSELENFLISLPVMGIAAIIDRPGYLARYSERYDGRPWRMDKTAFSILIEAVSQVCPLEGASSPSVLRAKRQAGGWRYGRLHEGT